MSMGMSRVCRIFGAALLLALSAVPTFRPSDLHAQAGIPVGRAAPAVTINDLDGKPVSLGDYIGKKPLYIQYWATWCELCEALYPRVQAARARYGAEVEFIGVNVTVNQNPNRVRRYIAEHQPPFRTLWDDKGVGVRAYDVPSTSFVVIVDRAGKVAYTGVGKDQDIEAALRKVVGR